MSCRSVLVGAFTPLVICGPAMADEVSFTPLAMRQGNTENRTGMGFCPDLGKGANFLPLKFRV
jgi:hypothetical protein